MDFDPFDENKPSIYLSYLDANNLYGLAMSQYLPYADFKRCELSIDDVTNYVENETGYILEVDLEYPKEAHDLHNDYPLAPELKTIQSDMLSPTSQEIYNKYNPSHKYIHDETVEKLILSLSDEDKHVVQIRNLKF